MTADAVGGVWQYSVELIEELTARGVEVALATLGPRPSSAQKAQLSTAGNLQLIESDFKLEWMQDAWDDVDRSLEWLLSVAEEFKPDLVHLNGYALADGAWQCPVLSVAHSCVYSWFNAVHGSEPGDPWQEYRVRVRAGIECAAAVVAPSRFMADAVSKHYGAARERIQVIHNGSDAAVEPGEKEPYLLAAGRMWDPAKNLSLLQVIAGDLQWPLRIAGSEAEQPGSPITYLGHLPYSGLLKQMAHAAIFVHPALYEPFGLAILEAARAGSCLLLADIPSLRELWQDAAVFVDPRKPDHWIAEVTRLTEDVERRTHLGALAVKRAEAYRRASSSSAYWRLYQGLAAAKKNDNGVAA